MTKCKQCNKLITEEINFCPHCGKGFSGDHLTNQNSSFLTTLCFLTIFGSILTLFRGLFYESISSIDGNGLHIRGLIYVMSSLGTLVGAIMMMKNKLDGLYIYTVFQVIYLITVLLAPFAYGQFSGFAFFIALFFLVPSTIFLILYWSNGREYLN